jgi:hypothetical protein
MAANLLIGAIDREYGLDYGVVSIEKATAIALQTSPRVFHFSKQVAIDNLPTLGDAPSAARWRDKYQQISKGVSSGYAGKISVFCGHNRTNWGRSVRYRPVALRCARGTGGFKPD